MNQHLLLAVTFLVVATLYSVAAIAQDSDCVAGEQDPVYDPRNPTIVKYEFERLESGVRELIETKDGLIAAIVHGGCAHYAFSVQIPVAVPGGAMLADSEVFAAALVFLEKLHAIDPKVGRVASIYSALRDYKIPKDYKLGEKIVEADGYSYFSVDRSRSDGKEFFARYVVIL